MSNEKLAEALRAFTEDPNPFTYRRCYAKAQEALQAHAAEAAQPLPQMTDAEHAEIQARYGTAQAEEPVRQFRVVPKGSVWTDVKDPEIWASVVAHPESYETRVFYTHPQPAQDARDAARYSTGDRVTWTNRFGTSFNGEIREHNPETYGIELDDGTYVDRAFPDDIHCAMAKESGR